MPLYEYQCPDNKRVFEVYLPISRCDELIRECPFHNVAHATKMISIPARVSIGKPTIVFTNPTTGDVRVATSSHEKPPRGYTTTELKSSLERSRFENIQNEIYHQQDEIYNEKLSQERSEISKRIREDCMKDESKIASESDNPTVTKELLRYALNRKPKRKLKKRHTKFAFDVNHKDASNLG